MKNITILILIISNYLFSNTILIPDDYLTIQEGIDASVHGDTVLVYPGVYRDINFNGKNIVVTSTNLEDRELTIISFWFPGGFNGPLVTFENNEDSTAVLEGFTIEENNQVYWIAGAGIYVENSSPTLRYLTIRDNHGMYGAGIYLLNSNSNLSHSAIYDNATWDDRWGGRNIIA